MSNYVFKRSDPANGSFLLQTDQIDGTQWPWSASLYINPTSALAALSSNSSLVLAGQGITDYGELVQTNLLHLMEHFAYKSRPLTPTQGQLWYKNADYIDVNYPTDPTDAGMYVWDGATWQLSLTAVGNIVNAQGLQIHNLGDRWTPSLDPFITTNALDALNRQTGDALYVSLYTGGTINGTTTFTAGANFTGVGTSVTFDTGVNVTVTEAPVSGLNVTNKDYVDTQDAAVIALVNAEATAREDADDVLAADITTINNALPHYIQREGDTMTGGTLTFAVGASMFFLGGTGSSISLGSLRVQQVADPISNQDAATKFYVDTLVVNSIGAIPPAAENDGVVTSSTFDNISGNLTLTRSAGLPTLTAGPMAPFVHAHTAYEVTYDLTLVSGQSYLTQYGTGIAGYPNIQAYNAIQVLDRVVSELNRPTRRQIIVHDGVSPVITLPAHLEYTVGTNWLTVYLDGVKQYVNERGSSYVEFSTGANNPLALTDLVAGPYSFDITVDADPVQTITITVPVDSTFQDLTNLISAEFSALNVYATIRLEQYLNKMLMFIESHTTGAGSGITISNNPGELFDSIFSGNAPTNAVVTTDLAYSEPGPVLSKALTFEFNTTPPAGAVIEVLVMGG